MKKLRWSLSFLLTILVCCGAAAALENDTVKVGLRYGSSAMFSANLENAVGSGYAFGYYDGSRSFVEVGETGKTAVSVTAAGTIYLGSSGYYESDQGQGVIGSGRRRRKPTQASKRLLRRRKATLEVTLPTSPMSTACALAAMRRRARPFWPWRMLAWTAAPSQPAAPAWW